MMALADQGMAAPVNAIDDVPELQEDEDGETGYSAAYAQLHFASAAEVDPYKGEAVPSFMIGSLSQLNRARPGVLSNIISQIIQSLAPEKQVLAMDAI